jgi:hypothetical protein
MKIGDKVKFLNDTGGGVIAKFIDPEMVLVRIEDGFEVPVRLNELIPDISQKTAVFPGKKKEAESQPPGEKAAQMIEKDLNSGQVYLAFTHAGNPWHLHLHLINDTNYHIYYIIGLRKLEQHLFKYSGSLEPDTKVVLGNFKITKTDEATFFSIQYIGFKSGYYSPFIPVNRIIEIDTQRLADQKYESENDFFDKPAALFNADMQNIESSKFRDISFDFSGKGSGIKKIKPEAEIKVTGVQKPPEIMEVDLHIHEIVDDESGLTDGEILDIQLRRFEMSLETALHGNVRKIVFIHGVGQGKLKFEIIKVLNTKYPDLKYQDASFKEYGYGATMVLI